MSETKPRRTTREAGRNEIAAGEAVPPQTATIIAPEAVAEAVAVPRAAAEAPLPAAAVTARPLSAESAAAPSGDDAWALCTEMQTALTRGFASMALEMTGFTRSAVAAATEAATAMLGARTLAEAVEINAGLIRSGADAMLEGSVRLSEIGIAAMSDASRPILERFGTSWSGARRLNVIPG